MWKLLHPLLTWKGFLSRTFGEYLVFYVCFSSFYLFLSLSFFHFLSFTFFLSLSFKTNVVLRSSNPSLIKPRKEVIQFKGSNNNHQEDLEGEEVVFIRLWVNLEVSKTEKAFLFVGDEDGNIEETFQFTIVPWFTKKKVFDWIDQLIIDE